MTFLFQSLLTIGLPLVAIPLLIHLINMRRHQPVRWAAMDFLLESQKRNKKWILLRQFLLLALRTTAILLAVVMLAGPVLMSQWGSLLGSGVTHHVLLVDDSYSMSDQWEDVSAWNQAKRAVSAILDQATSAVGTQKLTLLRFSQTAQLSAGVEVPISNRSLDRKVAEEVDALLENQPVTETAVGPIEVFQAALSLPRADSEEALVVYVVSDFRARQWSENPQARQLLSELRTNSADLHLIQCVEQSRPNLAITRLEPESGIRSAGVEMWMQLSVMNYGDQLVDSVPVEVFQDGQKLPAVTFDKVGPREEVTRRFRVALPTAGAHELVAQLPGDPVAADNRRFFACDVPNSFPLLVIDGSPQGEESFYLSTALNPTGTSKPGWSPQVEPVNFLRQHAELPKFAAIFLLDVPRLDDADVTALEPGGDVGAVEPHRAARGPLHGRTAPGGRQNAVPVRGTPSVDGSARQLVSPNIPQTTRSGGTRAVTNA